MDRCPLGPESTATGICGYILSGLWTVGEREAVAVSADFVTEPPVGPLGSNGYFAVHSVHSNSQRRSRIYGGAPERAASVKVRLGFGRAAPSTLRPGIGYRRGEEEVAKSISVKRRAKHVSPRSNAVYQHFPTGRQSMFRVQGLPHDESIKEAQVRTFKKNFGPASAPAGVRFRGGISTEKASTWATHSKRICFSGSWRSCLIPAGTRLMGA